MIIRVVVADDHPVYRYGLTAALGTTTDIEVVGEAVDGASAVETAIATAADVVLMDLHMPGVGGLDAIRGLNRRSPSTGVLVLSMSTDDDSLLDAIAAGARGYLVKGAGQDEIERAIRATYAGEVTFGAGIAARALARFGTAAGTPTADRPFPQLTEREAEILELIARGLSNADIARRLFLSEKTIRNNVSAIFGKLDVHDRAQAVARARDAGLGQ
jgi:DNA-binding NarL/FixJ family response regulator